MQGALLILLVLVLLIIYYFWQRSRLEGTWADGERTLHIASISIPRDELSGELSVLFQPGKDESSRRRVLAAVRATRKGAGFEGQVTYGGEIVGGIVLTPAGGRILVRLDRTGVRFADEYRDLWLTKAAP